MKKFSKLSEKSSKYYQYFRQQFVDVFKSNRSIRHSTKWTRMPSTAPYPFAICIFFGMAILQSFGQPGVKTGLYSVPNSTFYQQTSGETVVTINDTSGSISVLQGLIDAARVANPTKIIIINLKAGSHYGVTGNPLVIGSMMCLSGGGTTIEASSSAIAATSLIRISPGAIFSSVNNVTLNGVSADVYGIEAAGCSRVNIDAVTVKDTGRDGIFMQGNGITVFDNEMTVTRCNVSGVMSRSGIHILNATQTVCLENVCQNNGTGIMLETSSRAMVANNRCDSNTTTGIAVPDSTLSKFSNNSCSGNPTGISLGMNSQYNTVASNDIRAGSVGIDLAGLGQTLYDNVFPQGILVPLAASGPNANHNIITTSAPLAASGLRYFYPPTTLNNHSEAVMNSMASIDLTSTATTLSQIQTEYDAVRAANPNSVTVLHLTAPLITGDVPLVLGSYTCIIISGTINLNSGVSGITGLNLEYVSLSGGIIDGGNTTGRNGLSFNGCARVLVDHMTLRNFGDKAARVDGSDIIAFNAGGTPCVVGYCSINGGAARGIWTKGAQAGFIFTDNTASNVNMDGIDIDAFTINSLVKFNVTNGSVRTGIFVEESAKHNQVIGNTCNSNAFAINIQSTGSGPTSYNSIVANSCDANTSRGIRIGAASTLTTEHNFLFNNKITNTIGAAVDSQGPGSENYWSQHYTLGNTSSIGTTASAVFFNSPSSAINTAPTISSIVDQSTNEDTTTSAIPFTIGDAETATSSLTLTKTSSNAVLVPSTNIVLGGSGSNRTVTITPAANQYGTTTITLTVSDGSLIAEKSFILTVNPVNDAPTISSLANQSTNEDTATPALGITVADIDNVDTSLTLSASSSNTSLIPLTNIVFSGIGSNRFVTITPAANLSGSATITLTVSDSIATASKSFTLTVNAVNDAPTISTVVDQTCNEDTTTSAIAFTIGDAETATSSLTLAKTSSNTVLVPSANIVFGGSGTNRTVTITPAANQYGTTTITLTVSDGLLNAEKSFILTVNPVNDAPTISAIADQIIDEDTSTSALAFNIDDLDNSSASLKVTATSSNTTLIPNANIVLAGSAASRLITVTPAANENGITTISLTVSDGDLTATDTFSVTVKPVADAPIASAGSIETTINQSVDIDLRSLTSDAETPTAGLKYAVGSSRNGTVTILADGHTVRFSPNSNQLGNADFNYTVSDTTIDSRTLFNYDFQSPDVSTDGLSTDISGNGRNGTLTVGGTGSVNYATDAPNAISSRLPQSLALVENGLNGAARLERSISSATELDFKTADWSAIGWFKRTNKTNQDIIFHLGTGNGNGATNDFALSFDSGNDTLWLRNWSSVRDVDISSSVTSSAWHHFAVVHYGTSLSLYVDGTLIGSDSSYSLTYGTASPVIFGGVYTSNSSYWTRWFNGSLADIAIFNAALTASDIAKLYTAPVADLGALSTSSSVAINIVKKVASVTLGGLSTTYDGTPKSATATTNPSGLTVSYTYGGSSTAPTNAGTYAVVGTISDANYSGSATDDFLITKATPTISTPPTASAITYGQALYTSTLSGGTASTEGTFAFTTPSVVANAGTVSQSVTFTPTDSTNYSTFTTTADVTVNKATATVTLGGLSTTYDGTPKSATATTNPSGLTVSYTYGGSSTAPTNAGTYAVVGTINDANYSGSATGSLVIAPASRSYSAWVGEKFTSVQVSAGQSSPTADPDRDGLTNLAEYALDSLPYKFTPQPTITATANSLSITFQRRVQTNDVIYRAEASPNLIDWTALTVAVLSSGVDPETVRATYTYPNPKPAKQFIRLRFER